MTLEARLWAKVDAGGDCWTWTGTLRPDGYGVIGLGARGDGLGRAHRVVWELLIGPIPAGAVLDHLCRVRRCVNPDHLEVVTRGENVRRGLHRYVCKRGHLRSGSNLDTRGRDCLACRSERKRATR